MAMVLTIAGATKTVKVGTLNISQTANGRATAAFDVTSLDGSYRPALDAEVIITDGGSRIFGGLLDRPRERGVVSGARAEFITTVSAVDFHTYTDRRYVSATFASGTMKAGLTTLVANYLTGYGVTLDAGQVNGPTFPELIYEDALLTDLLNEWATLTGKYGEPFVWRIDAFKVLRLYQPSTVSAPFNVTGNTPQVIGDIEVESSREHYANRIILRIPAKNEVNHVETFTGDGTTSSFQLAYTLTGMRYVVNNNGVDELLTFQGIGFDLAVQWLYYAVDNTIRRETSGVPDPPANGNIITITFDGTLPAQGVIAEDAGEIAAFGIWEKVVTIEAVPSGTTAQALADAFLAQSLPTPKTIRYRTLSAGLVPGQTQTFTVSLRNLSTTAVITDVVTRDFQITGLMREVTAMVDADTNLNKGWRDIYKLWANTGEENASETTVGAGAPAVLGPAPPVRAIQFNDTGAFGGDASFIYYKDENSIVCGLDSSITAAAFESCHAFGHDCHIADP